LTLIVSYIQQKINVTWLSVCSVSWWTCQNNESPYPLIRSIAHVKKLV
jgi:hypothetical protein